MEMAIGCDDYGEGWDVKHSTRLNVARYTIEIKTTTEAVESFSPPSTLIWSFRQSTKADPCT